MPLHVWECDYCSETFAVEEDARDHEEGHDAWWDDFDEYDDDDDGPCGPHCGCSE